MRTNLAGAARATGCTTNTLLRWIAASTSAGAEERARRDDLFGEDEVTTGRKIGTGVEWSVDVEALERVHKARGGTYFNAEAALAVARLPPAVAQEMARLQAENADLRAEVTRLRRLLDARITQAKPRRYVAPRPPATLATLADVAEGSSDPRADAAHRLAERSATRRRASMEQTPWGLVPELPGGWVAVSTWCHDHHLDNRTVNPLLRNGTLAVEEGEWKRGSNRIYAAWTPAQQEAAARVLLGTAAGGAGALSPVSAAQEATHENDEAPRAIDA